MTCKMCGVSIYNYKSHIVFIPGVISFSLCKKCIKLVFPKIKLKEMKISKLKYFIGNKSSFSDCDECKKSIIAKPIKVLHIDFNFNMTAYFLCSECFQQYKHKLVTVLI